MATEQVTLTVRVSPSARRSEVTGWTADEKGRPVLLIKLAAPPVDGKANGELLSFMTELLGCSKSEIELVRGSTSRLKVLEFPQRYQSSLPGK
jgi:uncharacterized protein